MIVNRSMNEMTIAKRRSPLYDGEILGITRVDDLAFYVAYALYLIRFVLENSTIECLGSIQIEIIEVFIDILIILLLAFKMLFFRTNTVRWILACCVVGVCFVSWIISAEGWAFWLALFIVCGYRSNIRKCAIISICVYSIMIPCIMLFAINGIIDNIVLYSNNVVRWGMGFEHPNTVGMYILLICISYSVIRFGRNPLPDLLLLALAIVFNLTFCVSRSIIALAIVQGILLVVFYVIKKQNQRKTIIYFLLIMLLLLVIASLYTMVAYNSSRWLMNSFNSLLSGRLYLSHLFYEIGGITLLGNNYSAHSGVMWVNGSVQFLVDNAYCHIILRYGLLIFCMITIGLSILIYRMVKSGCWNALLFGIVLMVLYGFTETFAMRAENYMLFSIASIVMYLPGNNINDIKTALAGLVK